ncbi:MAG: hypothetical protein WAK95_06245, partial [Desulfobacterales bacterium]
AILLEFMGQTVHKSFVPVKMAQDSMELTGVVECLTANYRKHMLASLQASVSASDPLGQFKNDVETNNFNCGDYTATTSWIVFTGSGETNVLAEAADNSGENRVLKVTIVRGQHEVTALYTQ